MATGLHGAARTTPLFEGPQASQENTRALAARYGLNAKTVLKWRRQTSIADRPMGPGIALLRTIPTCAASLRWQPAGRRLANPTIRSPCGPSSRCLSRQRRNVRSESQHRSRFLLGSDHPAHAARATPQNASPVPFAAPPPDPSPALLSSGSKKRTDHALQKPGRSRYSRTSEESGLTSRIVFRSFS